MAEKCEYLGASKQNGDQLACSWRPLKSPNDSPDVSWDEKEVDVVTGEREVLASEDPPSDIEEPEAEDSEARSEVGEWERGVKPNSAK